MKKTIFLFLFLGFSYLKSQVISLTRIKLMKDDSSLQVTGGDTSYVYNAFVITYTSGGISTFTLSCKSYDLQSTAWLSNKDTSYTWANVSDSTNNNQVYVICKPNDNMLKVCLGRLDPATRRKFLFNVTGNNGILTKEFDF
jgi:hypothetical protein